MHNFDVRNFSDDRRKALALRVQHSPDFALPRLKAWNYEPCRKHRSWTKTTYDAATDADVTQTIQGQPKPGCRKCGIIFRAHQRVGIAWLYLVKQGLYADTMGSGKTSAAGGLIAMLLETGEIPTLGRAIVVPRSPALTQWRDELLRMMPGLNVVVATGTRKQRTDLYLQPWDVLLIGPEMLRNDFRMLERFPLALFVADDIDTLRNAANDTSYVMDRMGAHSDRYVIMSGTPLQKRLPELHSVLDGVGGLAALGNIKEFERRYIRQEHVRELDSRTGQETSRKKIVGYKNLNELKDRIAPLVLRRTVFNDVELPTIIPNDVMLDLYPAQRAKYKELQKGVIRILKEEGEQTKKISAMAKLHYGAAICAGLAALGEEDGPRTSVKYDWLVEKLTEGELQDEKVVVFANLKNSVRAIQSRLNAAGVGFVTVWGEDSDKDSRHASQARFWDDPKCRVLIGTKAIEQSLNLQVSRHLVNVDMILNPARMEQLAGRIRRDGSAYQHVFVHNLLTIDTQEERYLPLLEREAALAAHMWDENSQLFQALSASAMLQLISG